MNKLPESLVSQFAVTTRDVIWYKDKLIRVFERAGVPAAILNDVDRSQPTIKICQQVIDLLEQMEADGLRVVQTLLKQIAEWSDLSHLKEEQKRTVAKASQARLKSEIRSYADARRYMQRQEEERQRERESRNEIRPADHSKLQSFRERFDPSLFT